MQKEVLPSHKLRDNAYEYQNPLGLKEYNFPQKKFQNQLSDLGLSQTEQKF